MADYIPEGYYDGIVDADGNLTPYGQMLANMHPPKVARTGSGAVLINGGKAQTGSANNPNGPDDSGAGGGGGAQPGQPPGTPAGTGYAGGGQGGVGLPSGNQLDPGSLELGKDGHLYATIRTLVPDPLNPGSTKYGYVPLDLGNPEDAGFDWVAAQNLSGINVGVLQAHYQDLKNKLKQQTGTELTLGNFHIMGITKDASGKNVWKLQSNDGREVNISEDQLLGYQGLTQSDIDTAKAAWMRSQADLTKAGQWTYSSLSNKPGMVLIKNQGTNEIKEVSIDDAMDPTKFPGIDALEIQRAQQQRTEQNWMGQGAFGGQFQPERAAGGAASEPAPEIPPLPVLPGATPLPGASPRAGAAGAATEGAVSALPQSGTAGATDQGAAAAPTGYSWLSTAQTLPPAAAKPAGEAATPDDQAATLTTAPGSTPASPASGAASSHAQVTATLPGAKTSGASATPDDQGTTTTTIPGGREGGETPGTRPNQLPWPIVPPPHTQQAAPVYGGPPALAQFMALGSSGGQVPTGWSNQQLELANRSVNNMNNFIRQANTYSKNVSGLGFSGIQRPSVAGWG